MVKLINKVKNIVKLCLKKQKPFVKLIKKPCKTVLKTPQTLAKLSGGGGGGGFSFISVREAVLPKDSDSFL